MGLLTWKDLCVCSPDSRLPVDTFPQAELSNRQIVSTEIAKALEETRQQKEELQTQVCRQTHIMQYLK